MTSTLNKLVMFALGAVTGSLATWAITKSRIAEVERAAEEEIEAVEKYYTERKSKEAEPEKVEPRKMPQDKPNLMEYAALVHSAGYSGTAKEEATKMEEVERPYVIEPEEYGEFYDYGKVSLTYYADGVLTDEHDEIMEDEDVDSTIGRESLTHFGEYEEDSVFVRNDSLMSDYEILRDLRKYTDVVGEPDPQDAEDE